MTRLEYTRYEFRNASGHVCCSTTNPEYLCRVCKAKLAAETGYTPMRTAESLVFRTSEPLAQRPVMRAVVRKSFGEWCDFFGQKLRGYGSVVVREQPNVWDAINMRRDKPSPLEDARSDPRGVPPDGYTLALTRKDRR